MIKVDPKDRLPAEEGSYFCINHENRKMVIKFHPKLTNTVHYFIKWIKFWIEENETQEPTHDANGISHGNPDALEMD